MEQWNEYLIYYAYGLYRVAEHHVYIYVLIPYGCSWKRLPPMT